MEFDFAPDIDLEFPSVDDAPNLPGIEHEEQFKNNPAAPELTQPKLLSSTITTEHVVDITPPDINLGLPSVDDARKPPEIDPEEQFNKNTATPELTEPKLHSTTISTQHVVRRNQPDIDMEFPFVDGAPNLPDIDQEVPPVNDAPKQPDIDLEFSSVDDGPNPPDIDLEFPCVDDDPNLPEVELEEEYRNNPATPELTEPKLLSTTITTQHVVELHRTLQSMPYSEYGLRVQFDFLTEKTTNGAKEFNAVCKLVCANTKEVVKELRTEGCFRTKKRAKEAAAALMGDYVEELPEEVQDTLRAGKESVEDEKDTENWVVLIQSNRRPSVNWSSLH
jgi:hypothetical protein